MRLANTSTTGRGKGKELSELPNMLAMPEKVLAVISLLHDVRAARFQLLSRLFQGVFKAF